MKLRGTSLSNGGDGSYAAQMPLVVLGLGFFRMGTKCVVELKFLYEAFLVINFTVASRFSRD